MSPMIDTIDRRGGRTRNNGSKNQELYEDSQDGEEYKSGEQQQMHRSLEERKKLEFER